MPVPQLHEFAKNQSMIYTVEILQHGSLCYVDFIDTAIASHMTLAKHDLFSEQPIVVARKTWPFLYLINKMIQMQAESGIAEIWEFKVIFYFYYLVINFLIFLSGCCKYLRP